MLMFKCLIISIYMLKEYIQRHIKIFVCLCLSAYMHFKAYKSKNINKHI